MEYGGDEVASDRQMLTGFALWALTRERRLAELHEANLILG